MINADKKAKAIFLYQKQIKSSFRFSNSVLLISVGQPNHESAKFSATLELINRNFKSCDIAVCDVLQRHTMQIRNNYPNEEVYNNAALEGKKWLDRNKKSFDLLKIKHNVFFWEEYLLRSNFQSSKEKIIYAYNNDEIFKQSMDTTIEEFISRNQTRSLETNRDIIFENCFNYLVEECSIIMLMWQECDYHYIIYPGKMPKVLNEAYSKFVFPNKPELLKWLTVYVRSRSNRLYLDHNDLNINHNVIELGSQ